MQSNTNTGSNSQWVYQNTQIQEQKGCPVCASCASEVPPGGPLSESCPCKTAHITDISRTARSSEVDQTQPIQTEGAAQNFIENDENSGRLQGSGQDGGYCPLANGQGVGTQVQSSSLFEHLQSLVGQRVVLQVNGMNNTLVIKNGLLQGVENGFLLLEEDNGQTFLAALGQVQTVNTQN